MPAGVGGPCGHGKMLESFVGTIVVSVSDRLRNVVRWKIKEKKR